MGKSNTNMASEFWFFSQLHRLGYQAFITLGNTKSIDITVQLSNDTLLTFDVKGKETFDSGIYQFLPKINRDNHLFAFIGLQVKKEGDKINFISEPECYIVFSKDLDMLAFDWTASNDITKGYGLDQNILRMIKKFNNENEAMTKIERKRLNSFKNYHNLNTMDFEDFKMKVMSLADFEQKYYSLK